MRYFAASVLSGMKSQQQMQLRVCIITKHVSQLQLEGLMKFTVFMLLGYSSAEVIILCCNALVSLKCINIKNAALSLELCL
jgi:hypothetical protein